MKELFNDLLEVQAELFNNGAMTAEETHALAERMYAITVKMAMNGYKNEEEGA